ncbi:MAG: acylphosphatase [Spirochaetaceae bacterium]
MDNATYARVHGRVQGVGFRYQTRMQARRLGLVGWVRNAMDGSVEVLFSGPQDAREQMVRWLEEGPAGARVRKVDTSEQPLNEEYESFEIRG